MVSNPAHRGLVLTCVSVVIKVARGYTIFFEEHNLPARNFQTFSFVDSRPETCYQLTTTYPLPDITAVGVINGQEAGNFGSRYRYQGEVADNLRAVALYKGDYNYDCTGTPDVIIRFHDVDERNSLQVVDLNALDPSLAGRYRFWRPIDPDDQDWMSYVVPDERPGYISAVDQRTGMMDPIYVTPDDTPIMIVENFNSYDQARFALMGRYEWNDTRVQREIRLLRHQRDPNRNRYRSDAPETPSELSQWGTEEQADVQDEIYNPLEPAVRSRPAIQNPTGSNSNQMLPWAFRPIPSDDVPANLGEAVDSEYEDEFYEPSNFRIEIDPEAVDWHEEGEYPREPDMPGVPLQGTRQDMYRGIQPDEIPAAAARGFEDEELDNIRIDLMQEDMGFVDGRDEWTESETDYTDTEDELISDLDRQYPSSSLSFESPGRSQDAWDPQPLLNVRPAGIDVGVQVDEFSAPVDGPRRLRIRPVEDENRELPHVLPFYIPRARRPVQAVQGRRPVQDVTRDMEDAIDNSNLDSIQSYLRSVGTSYNMIDLTTMDLIAAMGQGLPYGSPEWENFLSQLQQSREDMQRREQWQRLYAPYGNLKFDDNTAQSMVELGQLYNVWQQQARELGDVLLNMDLDNVEPMDPSVARTLTPEDISGLPAEELLSYYLALDPERLTELRYRQLARAQQIMQELEQANLRGPELPRPTDF
ncbi:hypothetical protein H072_9449 [Dactylellina haptotyla CBS 200.50]|uniref:Uncharacterized protein n=1 Tax=Dactylellina haptotyla (strain CBS 200.50) TaxID=1284197 RepID=S8BCP7_DACHA|nr:hypothetical protein H072_9449 [Dactylellina haptotyla CBS 200.50]